MLNPSYSGMLQYPKIHQFNPLHKQTKKNHIIISLDAGKAFYKVQCHFMIKVLERSVVQGPYINIVKAIHSQPVASIKVDGEKLGAIPLK